MWPGGAVCVLVGFVEAVGPPGAHASALASGTVLAWALVSTLSWATTVTLPRFAGAIGWLLTLAIAATASPGAGSGRLFDSVGAGTSWLEGAVALLLYPPVIVGEDLAGPQGWLAAPAVLVATTAMVYAFGWIEHHDIPLEAAQ